MNQHDGFTNHFVDHVFWSVAFGVHVTIHSREDTLQ